MATHVVSNQPPPLSGVNLLTIDKALVHILQEVKDSDQYSEIVDYGHLMGHEKWISRGFQANQHPPVFHSHDRFGNRVDVIEYHPSYHAIMELAINHKLHSRPWKNTQLNSHLIRMGMYYMHAQNEIGTGCPLTMTFACYPSMALDFVESEEWINRITNNTYHPENIPWFDKEGITIGMAMTEKQGGTDVRSNTTTAIPSGQGIFQLTGHKWFCSAPMCDAFLTLAQTERGLSCFLFPRWTMDGRKNDFAIQRLKDKLGNRSNASSEIEFNGAEAYLIGEEGRGVKSILQMVSLTRYDCMIGSSALMRRGLAEVLHHIKHRKVHGRTLLEMPLMRNVVADLCLESEAALALTTRASYCLDHPEQTHEQELLRLLLPIGKYWITKNAEHFLAEAMECLGGNGYVEESILPRLFREAPVNAIWEGSGNVQCLDVLRAIGKNQKVLTAFIDELGHQRGIYAEYDQFISNARQHIEQLISQPSSARILTVYMALALQASSLIRFGRKEVAEIFCSQKLSSPKGPIGLGSLYGNLSNTRDISIILALNGC